MKSRTENNFFLYFCAALAGVVCFGAVYGLEVLNPLYVDWLLQGKDLTQHYIGWEYFRQSRWFFPPGLMDRICYPSQASIIFTDSIPLCAVFFKMLSPLLPGNFQYFGLWQLLCFMLQGIFAAKLLFCFIKNKLVCWIGSLFFIMAPVFLFRTFMHTALSSQWLVLAALCLGVAFSREEERKWGREVVPACILGAACGSIHMYFVPMCGIIIGGFCLARVWKDRKFFPKNMIGSGFLLAGYISGAGGAVYLMGGFSHEHQIDGGGLGEFSFNVNGFFNSMGWSRIFPQMSAYGAGFTEGFAYLGAGVFLLAAIALGGFLFGRIKNKKNEKKYVPVPACIFIVTVCFLAAASHKLAFNGKWMIELPYPSRLVSLWGMFRSSGRFIWPVVYLFMLGIIATVADNIRQTSLVILVLLAAFILQIYDISGALQDRGREFGQHYEYASNLTDPLWEYVSEGKEHVVFVSNVRENQDILYGVSQFALSHGMTINDFYLAHGAVAEEIADWRVKYLEELPDDCLFIFKEADQELCSQYDLEYYMLDGIIAGVSPGF